MVLDDDRGDDFEGYVEEKEQMIHTVGGK